MDSTKRNLIDKILILADTEPIVSIIVDEYSIKYKKSRHDVIQSHVNDIIMEILDKEIQFRKETEKMMKMMLSKEECILNIY